MDMQRKHTQRRSSFLKEQRMLDVMVISEVISMKVQKYYRVLYLYDHLKGGELVNSMNTATLFEVDRRTFQRDISDIRCYLANGLVLHGDCNEAIVYNRSKGGYEMKKIA